MPETAPKRTALVAVPGPFAAPLGYRFDGAPPAIGSRVSVPLGSRRKVVGVVTGIEDDPPELKADGRPIRYRSINAVLDEDALLDGDVIELCRWCADYYCAPLWNAVQLALPPLLRSRQSPAADSGALMFRLSAAGAGAIDEGGLTPKQRAVIDLLSRRNTSNVELTRLSLNRIARTLERRGLIERYRSRGDVFVSAAAERRDRPELTDEQHSAVEGVDFAAGYSCTLLYGVTGSGKTEVYLALAERALAAGRQALMLVPEIGLTPQLQSRIAERFSGRRLVCLHSKLSDAQRRARWLACVRGEADILLGTRSAVLTPLPRLGLIVVDEEHDRSYKETASPCYSGRDLAVVRAHRQNIPCVLGTSTPSCEALYRCEHRGYRTVRLTQRSRQMRSPTIEIQDVRGAALAHGELSEAGIEAVRATLEQDHQALLFRDQRGYAPSLRCGDCGFAPECPRCDVPLVLHRKPAHRLMCHLCGHSQEAAVLCFRCGSRALRHQGIGTERLEAALRATFPETPVVRIDRDSMRRWDDYLETMRRVREHDGAMLLVGTRMLSKGHDLPNLKLVCILGADRGLFAPDFRAIEHTAQLLLQLAGRAGRTRLQGRVIIQTAQPEHPLFTAVRRHDYDGLIQGVLDERRAHSLPPFGHLAMLRADSTDPGQVSEFMQAARTACGGFAGVAAIGPVPAPHPKREDRHQWQLMLSAPRRPDLRSALIHLQNWLVQTGIPGNLRTTLDIDPLETG
ncbi:MAG: primosomal protein N' [Gammaproteobacteria bacterium AqS3]|nr:primosomal protein N' [Gammaproteobacteria bacterium AqS3]